MNKFLILLFLFLIVSVIHAQESVTTEMDTTKTDTMFYNIDKQYYNIDVIIVTIDGFEWSIKNVDAKIADKENELNKLMKKYYRMGYESGWSERYRSWDSSPYLYVLAGVAAGVTGLLIWHGVK